MRLNKYSAVAMEYNIPYSVNISSLAAPCNVAQKIFQNRICVIAPLGFDSKENGEFGIYSHRRYARFAGEGAGVIFTEPIAFSDITRKNKSQLCLTENTLSNFKYEVQFIKKLSVRENNINPVVILRVDELDESLDDVCSLALKAGFDGVCVNALALEKIPQHLPEDIFRKTMIFAVDLSGCKNFNDTQKHFDKLSSALDEFIVVTDLEYNKNDFKYLSERISQISAIKRRNSGACVLVSGLTEFGEEGGNIAAGLIDENVSDLCGFSKQAVAYPSFARDLVSGGLEKSKCCILCGKCDEMRSAEVMSGCVTFDSEIFLPYYKKNQEN